MDSYTLETKAWLDERFRQTDEAGIFKAHQPIYGFRKGHFDPSYASRYIPSYHIMKSLSRLKFADLVDVGGAEGYKAYMAQRLFGIGAENSDLSAEACKRAEEIFHVKSTPVDIHKLPFADGEFDVVLCSETLEHVAELEGAVDEVLRVAKKAVVITVPHEDQDTVEKHVIEGKSHGHIHSFDLASFDYLEARGYEVIAKKIMSKRVLDYASYIENLRPIDRSEQRKWPKVVYSVYNRCIPLLDGALGTKMLAFLIAVDGLACRRASDYNGICCVILKDKSCYGKSSRRVRAAQVVKVAVPYYYLKSPAGCGPLPRSVS